MSIHRGGVENKKGVLKRHYYRWCYKAFENRVLVHMHCRGRDGTLLVTIWRTFRVMSNCFGGLLEEDRGRGWP